MVINDRFFQVKVLSATLNPQALVYQALHQCHSEEYVGLNPLKLNEKQYGEIAVKRLLSGDRGHYGSLEHPSITFAVGYFPHSVMQQARTHRVGISFDVQSGRYVKNHIIMVAKGEKDPESVFYLRPPGLYVNRSGKKYEYTEKMRSRDLSQIIQSAKDYSHRVETEGISEEQARGMLMFDIRQHFVVSFNLRSLLHFLDLRGKADAQPEIQCLSEMLFEKGKQWSPEIVGWYEKHRWKKSKLSP